MGRSAYWKAELDSLGSIALGDANRGAFLALQSAVSIRRRLVATDTPERRASSFILASKRLLLVWLWWFRESCSHRLGDIALGSSAPWRRWSVRCRCTARLSTCA